MNRKETLQFLALVRLAYPVAYRDLDQTSANATVNMWMKTFSTVPFDIMQYAFDCYRMMSKYPPTTADLAAQLKSIHYWAMEGYHIHRQVGNTEGMARFKRIMDVTAAYSVMEHRPVLGLAYNMEKWHYDTGPALNEAWDDVDNWSELAGNE